MQLKEIPVPLDIDPGATMPEIKSAELRSAFAIPNLNEPFSEIKWDSIYKFYKMNHLEWDGITRDHVSYHHLEIKYLQ